MMVVFVYHLYVSINYNTNINSAFCPEFTYFIEEFLWQTWNQTVDLSLD